MANGNLYNSPFEAQFDPDRAQLFIIANLLRSVHTCDLVKVLAVQPVSGKVGFVTVQPLVQETDTNGVVLEQTPIYNVPYMRYQGGSSAVILDPVAGDIGLAIFAENDITNVKQTRAQGPAATQRMHSTADALYIGGVLNPDPTQYVQFQPGGAGITIHTPGNLALQAAGNIDINAGGNVTVEAALCTFNTPVVFAQSVTSTPTAGGSVTFNSKIVAPDAQIGSITSFNAHKHTGVTTGSGTSGGPSN